MARKRYKPEEIVAKLRQVDVLVSQGQNMVDAIRQIGVSEVTYYRWRQEFGGLKTEQVNISARCAFVCGRPGSYLSF
jgi:putative transposase